MTKKQKQEINQWFIDNEKRMGKKYGTYYMPYVLIWDDAGYMVDPETVEVSVGMRPSIKKSIDFERLHGIIRRMTYRDQTILDMWCDGVCQVDIGAAVGTAQSEISIRIKKLLNYIRSEYNAA